MNRSILAPAFMAMALLSAPAMAQTAKQQAAAADMADLDQARQVLEQAQAAGAQTLATSLYDDATDRIRFATENWNASKSNVHEQARMRAREANFTARAALAKARWLSTNSAIRTMQGDIRTFGGTSDLALTDEAADLDYHRGTTTKNKIAIAQMAIDAAKQAGAMSLPDNDLVGAQQTLESANKVSRNGRDDNDVADHLAYISEMMARRAYYQARFNDTNRLLPDVQLQRTRLAQAYSERQAAAERQQREEAERRNAELQARLAQEQQNRAAQQAELERLNTQISEQRRTQQAQIEADRQARVNAERRLDELMGQYETSLGSNAPSADIDALRRQVEDQQIALRAIQSREQFGETSFESEITRLRTELDAARTAGSMNAEVLAQRQADLLARQTELETLRKERQADLDRRADLEKQQTAAIADATRRRQEAEAQAAQLRQQTDAAMRAAAEAQQQANLAQRQAEASQAQAADAERKTADTQAELERTRQQLASSTAETHRLQLQQSLARFAAARTDPQRGIIVTLPGIMFDTGKSTLKSGAKSTLKNIADQLKNEPTLVITVEGHTDNVGSEASNLKLSERRAAAVRDALVSNGVAPDHVTAIGKGESDPIAPNKTAAGKQQNRRVELILAP
jgi:outer membrane protein OmpA-like peptidoglycan-associated protein